MQELGELKGLVYQIKDEQSKNRALEIVSKIESGASIPPDNVKKYSICSCVDWRDMSPSPFCRKCGGKG